MSQTEEQQQRFTISEVAADWIHATVGLASRQITQNARKMSDLTSSVLKIYLFMYLFITTQQKDQRPLTLPVKAQEVKSTCNTQSTKHRETEKKK